ncbi:unnamed protein product [Calypogeia fissa]
MPPLLQPVTSLSPPNGPALVVTDKETWLGRGSFELSEKAQLVCSRRQACLKITNAAVTLECHGLNPIYFVVCHSVKFQASEDTPPARLHQLRRGESVELVDGDKFFLAPRECLLTVSIKPFKSDEASEQITPYPIHLKVPEDESLAVQICSPKATQLGQALTNSAVEQHRLPQTDLPLAAEVRINLADRCFAGDVCIRSPTEHKRCLCSSDESCQRNGVEDTVASPSAPRAPLIQDSPVRQVDSSKNVRGGVPTPGKVVIDPRRSTDTSKIIVVSNSPEQLDLYRRGAPLIPTQGDTLGADSFVQGTGCGSSIDAPEEILIRNVQPDTVSRGVDSKSPSNVGGSSRSDAREGSKQVITRNVSDCKSSHPLADKGNPVAVENVLDTRGSNTTDQSAFVSDGGHHPVLFRPDSSAAGGDSLNCTERCTLAASCSVEGRSCSSSNDITGEVVQSVHPDTIDCGLDSRSLQEPVLTRLPPGQEADKQLIQTTVSGYTASSLCAGPNQVQDDRPAAADLQQKSLSPGTLCNPSGIPIFTGCPEEAGASTSATILGRDGVAEVLNILMKQGNTEPVSPLTTGPSSQIPPPDGIFSEGICGAQHVREWQLVDLTISQNEVKKQAQIQSQTKLAGQSTCKCDGTGPVEGMTEVVVTVSGYEDLLRTRLINLISASGAAYTGSLTKRNTHVVCWKFSGPKYEMAKKLGKTIVNHCWFEDCLRAGIRLPEGPHYASGEASEPLRWDQSVRQHSSSAAGFDQGQDNNSLLLRSSRSKARSAIVIGESSRNAKTGERSGHSKFSPRSHASTLDRGKRHVDLNRSANRGYDCVDDLQLRALATTGGSPAVDLSTPSRPQEHESDDFWNEVIRAYDDTNEHVTEHSRQVLSEANNTAGLADIRTEGPKHPALPIPGSSLRERDPYHSEIARGVRNSIASLGESSRNFEDEILQGTTPPHSVVGEQAAVMHSECDDRNSYPEVFHRKRKQALEIAKYGRWKSRRLVRKPEVSSASGNFSSQEGSGVGTSVAMTTGGRPTFNSGAVQAEAFTVDIADDDCQQTPSVIIAESIDKTGEKGGESTPSNEITCVICHSDTKSITEGVLACGHQFCYPCIQRWADEAKSKSPTCPLCKVPFDFITFREIGKAREDGSCAVLEERIVQIGQQVTQEPRFTSVPSLRTENLCVSCGSRDTPELLLVCTTCRERACHTFCLDPPRPPGSSWFCSRCSQMQSRMQTREAYGRLFHGSSPRSARQRQGTVDLEMNVALQSRSTSRVGALFGGQSSGTSPVLNQAPVSGSTSRVDALAVRQSSGTPPRRGRQYSLHSFLVRQNDV